MRKYFYSWTSSRLPSFSANYLRNSAQRISSSPSKRSTCTIRSGLRRFSPVIWLKPWPQTADAPLAATDEVIVTESTVHRISLCARFIERDRCLENTAGRSKIALWCHLKDYKEDYSMTCIEGIRIQMKKLSCSFWEWNEEMINCIMWKLVDIKYLLFTPPPFPKITLSIINPWSLVLII